MLLCSNDIMIYYRKLKKLNQPIKYIELCQYNISDFSKKDVNIQDVMCSDPRGIHPYKLCSDPDIDPNIHLNNRPAFDYIKIT